MIEGLSHITLIVRNLDRMEEILIRIFDARKIYDSGSQTFSLAKERFFLVGPESAPLWIAIMEGQALVDKTYNHIAFKIKDDEISLYLERIKSLGLEFRDGRSRVPGEGQSLYFYDDDHHLFELHTGTLEMRLARYAMGR